MNILVRMYKKLVIGEIKNTETAPDIYAWKSFINSLPEPKDRIDEAFLKYRCRMEFFPRGKKLLLNAASAAVLFSAVLKGSQSKISLPKLASRSLLLEEKSDVKPDDVFPWHVIDEFESFDRTPELHYDFHRISLQAKALFRAVAKRYPGSPYFLLWVYKELAKHSQYIAEHNPAAVMVYIDERNVAGPILTEFYEKEGRELFSFMHGEYLYQLIQGYMDFSRYYVWDDFYRKMFSEELNCHIGRYCTYTPRKLQKKWELEKVQPSVFCTYYFSGESRKTIQTIAELFGDFQKAGKICKVRPHPRYSQIDLIKQTFPEDMIEDPYTTSMEASLGRAEYIVGLSTTVHSEAFVEGRTVVIDDISEPQMFLNLERREYICLNRPHMLLSDLRDMIL